MILSDEYTLLVIGFAVGSATGFLSAWLIDLFRLPPEDEE